MEGGRKKRSKYAGRGRQNTVCFYSKVVPDLLLKRDTEYNECRADIFLSDCQKRILDSQVWISICLVINPSKIYAHLKSWYWAIQSLISLVLEPDSFLLCLKS